MTQSCQVYTQMGVARSWGESREECRLVKLFFQLDDSCQTRAGAGYLVSLGNQSEETQVFLTVAIAFVIVITIE